ncbi:MAG: sulfur carrier protein ThiS [Mycobacterium sp.]
MKIILNDEEVQVSEPTTVRDLLAQRGIEEKGVAVAVDWAVLPRSRWESPLLDGSRVEVVTAVQGG